MFDKNLTRQLPCAMSVAGSDSGAGAGIQADLLTFAAHRVFGTTAIAAITAQNPNKVSAASSETVEMLLAQMSAIYDYFKPQAAKTGMLFNAENVETVANFFVSRNYKNLVVDPVMISTSGTKLLKDDAISAIKQKLIPASILFTPNLDEGAALLEKQSIENILDDAQRLRDKFGTSVLLKGGHLDSNEIIDVLADKNGDIHTLYSTRINGVDTHGSGCTLSAAIAANLAKGVSLLNACQNAQNYIVTCMKNPLETADEKFINHFPKK